ncbi:MAG: HD domain-containing protein [Candidatus Heimdallarchaeaceae archaeon]
MKKKDSSTKRHILNLEDFFADVTPQKQQEEGKSTISKIIEDQKYLWRPLTVVDPVFGAMTFEKEISRVINTADVQRLRNIKQLSLVSLQYPGADHSRFIHSLGVAHLISLALKRLKRFLSNINDFEVPMNETEELETIIAGLLHDIGHGPAGHVLDTLFARKATPFQHESFTKSRITESRFDLTYVLEDKLGLDPKKISALATGETVNDKAFLTNLIAGYGLDMDRLEYLLRDAYFTGVGLSHYNYNLLLDSALIIPGYKIDDPAVDKSKYYLGYGVSALQHTIEPLLLARALMYSQVYYSEANRGPQLMLVKALEVIDQNEGIDFKTFIELTDIEMWQYLSQTTNALARELVTRLKYRRLYSCSSQFSRETSVSSRLRELIRRNKMPKIKEIEDNTAEKLINKKLISERSTILIDVPPEKSVGNLYLAHLSNDKIESAFSLNKAPTGLSIASSIQEQMQLRWAVRVYVPFEALKNKLEIEMVIRKEIENI